MDISKRRVLIASLLDAGKVTKKERLQWYYGGLYRRLDLVRAAADELSGEVGAAKPDFLCALRGSGLPLASALAFKLNLKLVWFLEPMPNELVPGFYRQTIRQRQASVMMVDSHAFTGGTLVRHGIILHELLGASLCRPFVLFNCDSLGDSEYRDPSCEDWFRGKFDSIGSLATVSAIWKQRAQLELQSPFFGSVFSAMSSPEFWQYEVDDEPDENVPAIQGTANDNSAPGGKWRIPLLDDHLAKEYRSAATITVWWHGRRVKAIEPWLVCLDRRFLGKAIPKIKEWLKQGSYSTILAASYWGLPISLFLAHFLESPEVFCMDGEVIQKPTESDIKGKRVLLVDDTVKRGTDLEDSLRFLESAGADCSQCLVFLDNDSFPYRAPRLNIPPGVEIKALTSAKPRSSSEETFCKKIQIEMEEIHPPK